MKIGMDDSINKFYKLIDSLTNINSYFIITLQLFGHRMPARQIKTTKRF